VIQRLRERIAGVIAVVVFVATFGRVQVNRTGHPTGSGPRGANAPISAKNVASRAKLESRDR
jgi:hypothetical protein